jgi:hypothetical protein
VRITNVAQSAKRKDPPSEPKLGRPKHARQTEKVCMSRCRVIFTLTVTQDDVSFVPTPSIKRKEAPTQPTVERPKHSRRAQNVWSITSKKLYANNKPLG